VQETDAVVIALKSRTDPAGEVFEQSQAALDWLQDAGAEQYFLNTAPHSIRQQKAISAPLPMP
jgi:uncharacterized protein YgbK (DUF1537 family)